MRIRTKSGLQRLEIHSHKQNVYFIPHPARRWWHRGGFGPSEHGSSGVDSSRRSITGGTTPRGPSLSGSTRHTPESTIHIAPRAHQACLVSLRPYNNGRRLCILREDSDAISGTLSPVQSDLTYLVSTQLPPGTLSPVHSMF